MKKTHLFQRWFPRFSLFVTAHQVLKLSQNKAVLYLVAYVRFLKFIFVFSPNQNLYLIVSLILGFSRKTKKMTKYFQSKTTFQFPNISSYLVYHAFRTEKYWRWFVHGHSSIIFETINFYRHDISSEGSGPKTPLIGPTPGRWSVTSHNL